MIKKIKDYINYIVGSDNVIVPKKDTYELCIQHYSIFDTKIQGKFELVNSDGKVVRKYDVYNNLVRVRWTDKYYIYTKLLPKGRYHLRNMNGYTLPINIMK